MSDTAILGAVVAALWGVTLALLGVVWSMLRSRVDALDTRVQALAIDAATQRARSDGHDRTYEQLMESIARLETKLDRVLRIREE